VATAYTETCAAIGLVLFAHQMLLLNPLDYRAAHVLKRALYNGVLVGMGLNGKSFFYDNPLATLRPNERSDWFYVSCCPPNVCHLLPSMLRLTYDMEQVARLLTSLEKYIYKFVPEEDTLYVHLWIPSTVELTLRSGKRVKFSQTGGAPWVGGTPDWPAGPTFAIQGEGTKELKVVVLRPEFPDDHKWSLKPDNGNVESLSVCARANVLFRVLH
jgi:uncharacterized protein